MQSYITKFKIGDRLVFGHPLQFLRYNKINVRDRLVFRHPLQFLRYSFMQSYNKINIRDGLVFGHRLQFPTRYFIKVLPFTFQQRSTINHYCIITNN